MKSKKVVPQFIQNALLPNCKKNWMKIKKVIHQFIQNAFHPKNLDETNNFVLRFIRIVIHLAKCSQYSFYPIFKKFAKSI